MNYLIIAVVVLTYIHIGSIICSRRSSQGYEITKLEYYLTLLWPIALIFGAIGMTIEKLIRKK